MKKIILFILFLSFIIGLFVSSGQTYEQQSLIPLLQTWLPSKPFESMLAHLKVPYWGKIISIEERGYYHFIEFLLRKSAHFFIFGAVACVLYLLLPKHSLRALIAFVLVFLLASADEFHQSVTGGRTATYQDVILDVSGAIICLAVLKMFLWLKKKIKGSKGR